MADYKLRFLSAGDEPSRAIDLDCEDDDHAIRVVQEHLIHDQMELWQGDRLVMRFGGA